MKRSLAGIGRFIACDAGIGSTGGTSWCGILHNSTYISRPFLAVSQRRPHDLNSNNVFSTEAGPPAASRRLSSAVAQTSSGGDRRSSGFHGDVDTDSPKSRPLEMEKATILKKTSRYEYEKSLAPGANDFELERILASRGSDFRTLLNRHDVHLSNVDRLQRALGQRGVECTVVENADLNSDVIDASDAVFSAGGDGIFLMAATKVVDPNKPVIGINTDPTRSEGHLCLPKRYTNLLDRGIDKLMSGDFHWLMRKRIRLAMTRQKGAPLPTPILLKDQIPASLEHRFSEHEQEINDSKLRKNIWERPVTSSVGSSDDGDDEVVVLPSRALNDVFIGESISARVSYFEMSIDGKPSCKHKCSGLVVATGTGSNSWYLNIHKLSADNVKSVVDILRQEGGVTFPDSIAQESRVMERVAETYNRSLTFDPTEHKLAYIVRDPIVNRVFRSHYPEHGFADALTVRSRMFDACLVIDGGISYVFNDGATVSLSMHDEDSLRTVRLIDD